jgi:hypothetical protein
MASEQIRGRTRTVYTFHGGVMREKRSYRDGKDLIDLVSFTPPTCAHGHVMHREEQIAGQCGCCGAWLCDKCTGLKCALDRNMVCERHAERNGDRIICTDHCVARRVAFLLLGF